MRRIGFFLLLGRTTALACSSNDAAARAGTTSASLTPPAALTAALATASPGEVTCTPDDAPAMLFSDDPESPTSDGVLCADAPPAGRYRVYVYHANGCAALRKFPVSAGGSNLPIDVLLLTP